MGGLFFNVEEKYYLIHIFVFKTRLEFCWVQANKLLVKSYMHATILNFNYTKASKLLQKMKIYISILSKSLNFQQTST